MLASIVLVSVGIVWSWQALSPDPGPDQTAAPTAARPSPSPTDSSTGVPDSSSQPSSDAANTTPSRPPSSSSTRTPAPPQSQADEIRAMDDSRARQLVTALNNLAIDNAADGVSPALDSSGCAALRTVQRDGSRPDTLQDFASATRQLWC